jgi:hypothetical protein
MKSDAIESFEFTAVLLRSFYCILSLNRFVLCFAKTQSRLLNGRVSGYENHREGTPQMERRSVLCSLRVTKNARA